VYPVPDSSWIEGSGNGIDGTSAAGPGLAWRQVDTNGDGVIDTADVSPYVPNVTQAIAALGPVVVGQRVTVDVTAALQAGPQVYTLAIGNASTDGATYSSKDHPDPNQRPRLRLELASEPCAGDDDCDDGNECTTDACTGDLFCRYTVRADATGCDAGTGLCCDGVCTTPSCATDADCDDGQPCTADACQAAGSCVTACVHAWPACGGDDACCAPECAGVTDPDCPPVCGNGLCEGRGEDCTACPEDCLCTGNRCKKACCGDGVCSRHEGSQSCPVDCAR
jgi:hypothetical protein